MLVGIWRVKDLDISAFSQTIRKRIYIAPGDKTDIWWTGSYEEYEHLHVQMLDYYLDLADQTADEPSEFQSRWNCDGGLWVWNYKKHKPAADFERLISRIRDGHIGVPLNPATVCLGGTPAEAVLRGMYYPGQIERRYNLRFLLAYAIENQTLPYGLGTLWAGAGAKYSWNGICGCASRIPDAWDREHDIYWWVGPDGSRILVKWNSMLGDMPGLQYTNQGMGGYSEARYPSAVVDYVDTDPDFISRYPYQVIGAFGHGWDDLETYTNQFVTVAKNKTNASREVIVSNMVDFFEDFEATFGTSLPSVSASFGNEWELYGVSMAEVSARVKRTVEKLRGAEALATLVSCKDPSFMNGRQAARDQAWMNLGLYWEHDWTADSPRFSPSDRANWQRELATGIENYINTLHDDAASSLAGMIKKSGSNLRFYAFNPLSWTRTDIADLPYSNSSAVHIVDLSTGQETPSQLVNINGQQYLRVLAQNVPSVGYKVFEVRSGASQSFPGGPSVNASSGVIENDMYRVTVAKWGAITSLLDKTRGNRQFAKGIGGYHLNDLGSSTGVLAVENAGPVSATLRATAAGPLAHTARITLIRESGRIDIRNQITQNFNSTHTWRYGFNLDSPDVWHEEVGAVIRAKLLADGGHYSPRNARYDWLTLNHFADISGNGGVGVTLSNADCYFMKLGNSTPETLDVNTPQISPLVGGQVDGSSLGIPNQGGDSNFLQRFALQTHDAYDPAAAMRFALEHQNPLITGTVAGGSDYPEQSCSFLSISNPNVLLWALKPADDGIDQGIVARVWNLSTDQASFSLSQPFGSVTAAQHVTHIETPVGDATIANGALTDSLSPQQLKTYALDIEETRSLEKITSSSSGNQGASISFTLSFFGTGNTLTLTDTLPQGVSAPYNFEMIGTNVTPSYDGGQRRLTWSDTPPEGRSVIIRYTTTITVSHPTALVNRAELNEVGGDTSTAQAIVIANPLLTYVPLILKKS